MKHIMFLGCLDWAQNKVVFSHHYRAMPSEARRQNSCARRLLLVTLSSLDVVFCRSTPLGRSRSTKGVYNYSKYIFQGANFSKKLRIHTGFWKEVVLEAGHTNRQHCPHLSPLSLFLFGGVVDGCKAAASQPQASAVHRREDKAHLLYF